jgi:hypothetical protein
MADVAGGYINFLLEAIHRRGHFGTRASLSLDGGQKENLALALKLLLGIVRSATSAENTTVRIFHWDVELSLLYWSCRRF